jgi:hypothetical protein
MSISPGFLKKISASMFALILICFFLPFITISCQSQDVITMTGLQMATGVEISVPNSLPTNLSSIDSLSSLTESKKIPGNSTAVLAFCTAAAGLTTTLLLKNRQQKYLIPAISGGLGTLLLLFLKSNTDDSVLKQGSGMIKINYGLGFWLALILFLGAAGLNGYQLMEDRKPEN